MAMRLVGVSGREVSIGTQDILAAYNPQPISFGTTHVTLASSYQSKFVVGGFERADMTELVAAILLQEDFKDRHWEFSPA